MTSLRAWLLVLLTSITFLPGGWRDPVNPYSLFAHAGLVCAPLIAHLLRRTGRAVPIVWWSVIGVVWTHFYLVDLGSADFQVVLLAVPLGALAMRLIRNKRWLDDLAAGALLGFACLWGPFVNRADNGCTGVSSAYQVTLLITTVAVFAFGPAVLAAHLRDEA